MKEFRNELDRLLASTHQERVNFLYEFLSAPITYARELKETVALKSGGGLRGEIRGIAAAAAPIIIPLAFPIASLIRGNGIAAGILTGLAFWVVSSAVVKVLHDEGAIGSVRKG